MQIVTDGGMDLTAEQAAGLDCVHRVPLYLILNGTTYRSGIDIQPQEFYQKLAATPAFPTTTPPTVDDFVELYRRLAARDEDILSVHISSGLSDTIHTAREGANQVPEARVTLLDSRTLSVAQGWQVQAAAHAAGEGWSQQQILNLMARISAATDTMFTLDDLRYLIHGGRISHLKGLMANMLDIKPLFGVDKRGGIYAQRGQARSFKRAARALVEQIARQYPPGSALRVQVVHARNPAGAELLTEYLDRTFDCTWLPRGTIAPVLGAHAGPSLIGVCYAPQSVFAGLPWV